MVLVFCLFAAGAAAAAHEAGTPFAEWMMSLKQPDHPLVSCCGPADQIYPESYRANDDGGFIATVDGHEILIPPEKVIWDRVNPTGRGVLFLARSSGEFWSPPPKGYFVYCFVPAVGT